MIAAAIFTFIINVIISMRSKERAGDDPWDARTLEWAIPSPPPVYNFAEIPKVTALDDFWHKKYIEKETGEVVPAIVGAANGEEHHGDGHDIHLPSPSYWPFVAALGPVIMAFGFIYDFALVPAGAVILLIGIYAWALEPATEAE
jgi:cytochrome c oxidase subunit 1